MIAVVEMQSPTLMALASRFRECDKEALVEFWAHVKENGAPLMESIPGDSEHMLVTFLWQAETEYRKICLLGDFFGFDASHQLEQLTGTDIWYKTYRIRNDVWSLYLYSLVDPDDDNNYEDRRDPLNPIIYTCPQDKENPVSRLLTEVESVFALPEVKEKPWEKIIHQFPTGRIQEYKVASKHLNNERRVWVYTPHAYDPNALYPLIVVTDGWEYLNMTQATSILDQLIGKGDIPPLVALFVDIIDFEHRAVELKCYAPFAEFLCKELLEWADERFRLSQEPQHRVVVGASAGGLCAAYIGLYYSHIFGNVLAQSGAFQWKPDNFANSHYLASYFEMSPKLSLKFYLEVGLLEPEVIIAEVSHLAHVLLTKGYTVHYREQPSGHNFVAWNSGFSSGLKFLLNR